MSSLEHFCPDPSDTLSKVALFCEKMHEVFKNKVQRCCIPLTKSISSTGYLILVIMSVKGLAESFLNCNRVSEVSLLYKCNEVAGMEYHTEIMLLSYFLQNNFEP